MKEVKRLFNCGTIRRGKSSNPIVFVDGFQRMVSLVGNVFRLNLTNKSLIVSVTGRERNWSAAVVSQISLISDVVLSPSGLT